MTQQLSEFRRPLICAMAIIDRKLRTIHIYYISYSFVQLKFDLCKPVNMSTAETKQLFEPSVQATELLKEASIASVRLYLCLVIDPPNALSLASAQILSRNPPRRFSTPRSPPSRQTYPPYRRRGCRLFSSLLPPRIRRSYHPHLSITCRPFHLTLHFPPLYCLSDHPSSPPLRWAVRPSQSERL